MQNPHSTKHANYQNSPPNLNAPQSTWLHSFLSSSFFSILKPPFFKTFAPFPHQNSHIFRHPSSSRPRCLWRRRHGLCIIRGCDGNFFVHAGGNFGNQQHLEQKTLISFLVVCWERIVGDKSSFSLIFVVVSCEWIEIGWKCWRHTFFWGGQGFELGRYHRVIEWVITGMLKIYRMVDGWRRLALVEILNHVRFASWKRQRKNNRFAKHGDASWFVQMRFSLSNMINGSDTEVPRVITCSSITPLQCKYSTCCFWNCKSTQVGLAHTPLVKKMVTKRNLS